MAPLPDEEKALQTRDDGSTAHESSSSARTLLPGLIASSVTTVTGATSLGLRVGTKIGGWAIGGAREATLGTLELSRAFVEAILIQAGRDVASRRNGEIGYAEAESILERSITALHSAISTLSFATSAGFYMATVSMNTASDWSQHGLSTLNAILGSTESSRAVAAILTFVRDEFNKPDPKNHGEVVAYLDLFAGIVGFVLLQRWGRRKTNRQFVENGGEEIIWDAVVDDKGFRADVVGTQLHKSEYFDNIHQDAQSRTGRSMSFVSPGGDMPFEVVPREPAASGATTPKTLPLSLSAQVHSQLTDDEIRDHIMGQLPDGAHATITSETISARTIKVDIYDTEMADISAPPGTVLIAERFHHDPAQAEKPNSAHLPQQTVVFQTALTRTSSSELKPLEKLRLTATAKGSPESAIQDDIEMQDGSSDDSAGEELFMSDASEAAMPKGKEQGSGPRTHPTSPSPLATALANQKKQRKPVGSESQTPSQSQAQSQSQSQIQPQPQPQPQLQPSPPLPVPRPQPQLQSQPQHQHQPQARSQPVPQTFSQHQSSSMTPDRIIPFPTRAAQKKSIPKPKTANTEPKMATLRKALKNLSPTQSSTNVRETISRNQKSTQKPPEIPRRSISRNIPTTGLPRLSSDIHHLSTLEKKLPKVPQQQQQTSPVSKRTHLTPETSRSLAKSNYYAVREQHRDSLVSQTDSYSVRSVHSRPGSPTFTRTHVTTTTNGLSKTKSEKDIWLSTEHPNMSPESKNHHRSRSFVPSLYSVGTKDSEGSLIIAPKNFLRKSIFEDQENVMSLIRDGKVPGIFPDNHLVKNVRRFVRFSSASYGKSFLRIMGLTDPSSTLSGSTELKNADLHHEHESFSQYTGLPPDTILLSSFVDPHGVVTPLMKSEDSALPLVHYISIDHDSRAVVLTCRGTLGVEDVLTDMMCDYDDLYWRGTPYKVHKGIHASARRLFNGTGSRVMATLTAALEEYPDFGLVLCGHSLGGAVASLLAVLISEPRTSDATSSLFATVSPKKLLSHPSISKETPPIDLPGGRSIHVYAYGPPATMSPALRLATRGLITTIVNGADIVPSLSIGLFHDFRSIAIKLKSDTTDAFAAIKTRVMERIRNAVASHFYVDHPPPANTAGDGVGEDAWAWAALKTLRAEMESEKLVPPGEVFVVETMRVFDRSSSEGSGDYYPSLGRAATRVTMKYIRDVETRFGELRFGSRMFSDHSPGRYEASISSLSLGILEDE